MSKLNEERLVAHPAVPNGGVMVAFAPIEPKSVTRDEFSIAFDRHFDRVYSYVRKRIGVEPVCERVVTEVLVTQLHLLVYCVDPRHVACGLKAASDRLIEKAVALAASPGLETLTAAVERLAHAGFQGSFQVREGKLFSLNGQRLYDPKELIVDEIVRFEGDSDPGDSTVLFALRSRDGSMCGTFVAGYGTAADPESAAVVSRLKAGHSAENRGLEHQTSGSVSVLECPADPTSGRPELDPHSSLTMR